MSISIANKSLHAISITEIFIMKKKDGQFYRITIKKFEDPLIIADCHPKRPSVPCSAVSV